MTASRAVRLVRGQKKSQQPPQVVINGGRMSRRQMTRLAQQVAVVMPQQPAAPAVPGAALADTMLAKAHAHRFRRQLIPAGWLLALLSCAGILHLAHAISVAVVLAIVAAAAMVLLTRHLSDLAKLLAAVLASLTVIWLPLLTVTGASKPWPFLLAACFVVTCWWWAHRNRLRLGKPQQQAKTPVGDAIIWKTLAAEQKWHATLGDREQIPGGRRYLVICNGAKTDIGQVMSQGRKTAAAWDTSMTSAYVERSPDGVESRGSLTLLERNTLEVTRLWGGRGADPATGIAVIGRYADGADARVRFWAPRDGTKHGLVAGDSGSGKSYLLDLIIRVAIESGVVTPFILDPQEGQSLPQWQDALPYAAGIEECMALLERLHKGMLDRSHYLKRRAWTKDNGQTVRFMNFYDPLIASELPVALVIADEVAVLLGDRQYGTRAKFLLEGIAKMGRKTGFSLWPVVQVPSLEQLGGSRVLRSMLTGGSAIALRTADKASKNMMSMGVDPADLPKAFPNGDLTYGLGLIDSLDMRTAPFRTDLIPQDKQDELPDVRPVDDRLAPILEGWRKGLFIRNVFAPPAPRPVVAAAPPPADDAPEGRRAADVVMIVLTREMERGEICRLAGEHAVREWGRPKPFGIRAIADALRDLSDSERIAKGGGGIYSPIRPSLHAVPNSAPVANGASR